MHEEPNHGQRELTEEYLLGLLGEAIDLAFTEQDPYFRRMYQLHLMFNKWQRAIVLQSGVW